MVDCSNYIPNHLTYVASINHHQPLRHQCRHKGWRRKHEQLCREFCLDVVFCSACLCCCCCCCCCHPCRSHLSTDIYYVIFHKSGPFKSCSSRIACQSLTDTTAPQGLANITSASQTRAGSCTAARYIMLFWENAILFQTKQTIPVSATGVWHQRLYRSRCCGTRGCIGHGVVAPDAVPVAVLRHHGQCWPPWCGTMVNDCSLCSSDTKCSTFGIHINSLESI